MSLYYEFDILMIYFDDFFFVKRRQEICKSYKEYTENKSFNILQNYLKGTP